MSGLDTPLTPLRLLERAALAHPDSEAVIDGPRRLTYREYAGAATRYAHALRASGIRPGDRVAYLAHNSAEVSLAHFSVALGGGVLVTINTRLSPEEVAYILEHSEATIVFAHAELVESHGGTFRDHGAEVVVLPEQDGSTPVSGAIPTTSYADFLARGSDEPLPWSVDDETSMYSLNYTSGTTGNPKGVVYTHRGAYLNSLGQVIHQEFTVGTRYLWTLPMFHCNGWCSAWAVVAAGGTQVCIPAVRGPELWHLLDTEKITHMAGAPTVLAIMGAAEQAHRLDPSVTVVTSGAPPNPSVIERFHLLNARIIHVYGLTEVYGPYAICEWQPGWADLPPAELSAQLSRQGIGMVTALDMRVVEAEREEGAPLVDVPWDGVTPGEIVMCGNTVMAGYFKDDEATRKAFDGGWFHTGDLGVRHPDGYVQLVDRAKDVVISGGENISSVEVEQTLMRHPAVSDAAVIGVPDERWGERPMAFVVLAAGSTPVTTDELVDHVKEHIAKFKAPKIIEFVTDLPKTATGKVRKNVLKEQVGSAPATVDSGRTA